MKFIKLLFINQPLFQIGKEIAFQRIISAVFRLKAGNLWIIFYYLFIVYIHLFQIPGCFFIGRHQFKVLFYLLKDNPFQQSFLNAVSAASHGFIFCLTDIEYFLCPLIRIYPFHHRRFTVCAYQYAAEQICRVCLIRGPAVIFQKILNRQEVYLRNNGLMGILHAYPFFPGLINSVFHFIINLFLFALHHGSEIHRIYQNAFHRYRCPFCGGGSLKAGMILHAKGFFIFHGRQDACGVQFLCDCQQAHSRYLPCEYLSDNVRRIFVDYQAVLIFRVLLISINRECADTFPFLALYRLLGFHFYRNIPAITVIYKIFYRQDQTAFRPVRIQAVKPVCNRNKAHI